MQNNWFQTDSSGPIKTIRMVLSGYDSEIS